MEKRNVTTGGLRCLESDESYWDMLVTIVNIKYNEYL